MPATLNKGGWRARSVIRLRVRYRDLIGEWFDYLMVSQAELQEIVQDTGWRIVEFLESGGAQYVTVIEKE